MSSWCYLQIDTGGPDPAEVAELGNLTWNLFPILSQATGVYLREWEGKTGVELIPLMERGIARILSDDTRYRALEPENGWGKLEDAVAFLRRVLVNAKWHPRAYFHISG